MFTLVASLQSKSDLSANVQKDLKALVDTRTNDKWASAEADNAKAREESAKSMAKAAPRKSAAIKIEVKFNFNFLSILISKLNIF